MKRESDNEEVNKSIPKKPRISKSSDQSEQILDSSGHQESCFGVKSEKKQTYSSQISGSGNSSEQEKSRFLDFDLNVPTPEAGESVAQNKWGVRVIGISSDESSDDSTTSSDESSDDSTTSSEAELQEIRKMAESFLRLRDPFTLEMEKMEYDDYWLSDYWHERELRRQGPIDTSYERSLRFAAQQKSMRIRTATDLARNNSKSEETGNIDANLLTDLLTGDGPFSAALRNIVSGESKSLAEWSNSVDGCHKSSVGVVPSLLELSLKGLAKNAAAIVSLEGILFVLRKPLADLICSLRGMNAKTLDLFVKGSPTEICMQDCHWLTQDQFSTACRNIDGRNLVVLQLELCGQCNFDYEVGPTFASSLNNLPNLAILSLKGAARLTDNAVKALVKAAPALQSINLSQCSLLTEKGINFIADAFGPTLKELYIDDFQSKNAKLIKAALLKFKNLEVLSVAGIPDVCDELVEGVVIVCRKTLKELNLADCSKLTNYSLHFIASTCSNLHALNISKLHQLTDMSLEYLANGCPLIQSLTLHGNQFSDEVIAAFLEISGMSLKNLSLNHVSKVGCHTAMSLAKHSRGLLSLDLSWCRRVSNEELGLIVDRCLSLRLLKLFGCSQITDVFLNGLSNTQVQIVGLKNTPLLTFMDDLKPEELLLRYSDI